ncbi:calcium-binding protein [Pseudomonas sp. GB2N2]
MAQLFSSASDDTDIDAIKISDSELRSFGTLDQEIADFIRKHPSSSLPQSPPRSASVRESALRALDQYHGPLTVGSFTVSRVELHLMSARVHGAPLDLHNSNFRRPPQSFIDGLKLNPIDVENRIWASGSVGDNPIPTLLFEIATHRSVTAPPLLEESTTVHTQKIDRLLQAAQKLDIRDVRLPENTPRWVNKQKSKVVNSMGVGLQAFGIYSGLMGICDAIKKGDRTEAAINAGAVVTELGSLIIERGLVKTAQDLIENSARLYKGFSTTRFGLFLSRAAGLIAGALTLPFDLYFAIKAINDASQTTGKAALDHYVAAGMNLTSAALTILLGSAALAGFAQAGPVGIAAAAILIAGAQIYSAVRQVDDLDDYIEFSADERLVTGFLAFLNIKPPQRIRDRHSVAFATHHHSKQLNDRARQWLDGAMKNSVEAIVNGRFEVGLKTTQVHWFEWDAEGRESTASDEIRLPALEDADDRIDASNGIPADLSGVIRGTAGESKAIVWLLGGGNDNVTGLEKKPNRFVYGTGIKQLTGGEKDDDFLFEVTGRTLKPTSPILVESHLNGGPGDDTLVFQGSLDSQAGSTRDGFEINLINGRVNLLADRAFVAVHSRLDSVEHVETLTGASNIVTGSDKPNRIVSKGDDQIDAGGGNDKIYLMGHSAHAKGGTGKDEYYIAPKHGTVTLGERAGEESVIMLGWPFESIQEWVIEGESLVITSLCGNDGEWPDRVLVVEGIYQTEGDKRLFQDQVLHVFTQDGFRLTPDFPAELDGVGAHELDVVLLARGTRPAPQIINQAEYAVPSTKSSHYFVDRDISHSTFKFTKADDGIFCSIHVDCDSTEMSEARATYQIEITENHSNHYLNYSPLSLRLKFGDKTLILENLSGDSAQSYTNVKDTSYMIKGMRLNHDLILTMRDGVSFRIALPIPNYFDDVKSPGTKVLTGQAMLKTRNGKYLLLTPEDSRPLILEAHPQLVEFPSHPQNTVAALEGQGSTYQIKLNADTTLRISTPGASAKTGNASTWYFHSQLVDPDAITLRGNKLSIGRTLVLLPEYEDENIPIENIYVRMSAGALYTVDLVFEQVYLHSATD